MRSVVSRVASGSRRGSSTPSTTSRQSVGRNRLRLLAQRRRPGLGPGHRDPHARALPPVVRDGLAAALGGEPHRRPGRLDLGGHRHGDDLLLAEVEPAPLVRVGPLPCFGHQRPGVRHVGEPRAVVLDGDHGRAVRFGPERHTAQGRHRGLVPGVLDQFLDQCPGLARRVQSGAARLLKLRIVRLSWRSVALARGGSAGLSGCFRGLACAVLFDGGVRAVPGGMPAR